MSILETRVTPGRSLDGPTQVRTRDRASRELLVEAYGRDLGGE